jgi:AraC family transcriptional regulator
VAALSRFHWARTFTAMTGETPAEAVRRARLNAAARMLAISDRPLSLIGAEVGYPNPDSFARAFRAGFGVTPQAVRSRGILPPPLPAPILTEQRMYQVTVTEEPAFSFAALEYRGPYWKIGGTFMEADRLIHAAGQAAHIGPGIGIYYDSPGTVPEAQQRAHAGCVLAEGATLPKGMERVHIPGGKVAVLRYTGPYSGIPAAWTYAYGTWLPTSGQVPADRPPYERYVNDMATTPEAELVTEIVIPLR